MIHKTADSAFFDDTLGAKTLQCTLAEALRLAGANTMNVTGREAWFSTPIAQEPGQRDDDPFGLWLVPVSEDRQANAQSVRAFKAARGL